jgi:hypothetical protein
MRAALVVVFLLCLNGCASMNEAQCRNADWKMIGFEDGMAGKSSARIGDHRQACAKHNLTPDLDAYNSGHAEGVRQFCTEANGFNFGRSGKNYSGICPEDQKDQFMLGYRAGKELYVTEKVVRDLSASIKNYAKQINTTQRALSEAENLLVSDKTSEKDRRILLAEVKELQQELQELQKSLSESERLLIRRQDELESFKQMNNY